MEDIFLPNKYYEIALDKLYCYVENNFDALCANYGDMINSPDNTLTNYFIHNGADLIKSKIMSFTVTLALMMDIHDVKITI